MFRSILAVLLFAALAQAQPPKAAYWLDYREKQRVTGVLEYAVKCPNVVATEWIVAVPVAPELTAQKRPKTTCNLPHKVVKEKSDEAREVIVVQAPAKTAAEKTGFNLEVTYEATLYSRELKPLKAGEPRPKFAALDDPERKLYLVATTDLNFADPAFQKWLDTAKLKRGAKETDVDFARRVFEQIRGIGKYEYGGKIDRRASVVCGTGRTDCGGFSQLFTAAMRANGIPARSLFGRWAESAKPDAKIGKIEYFQWHVIAEFYADGIGWVPVDLASTVVQDKPGTPTRHFGIEHGTFLTQHIDGNLLVDSIRFGIADLQNIQQPSWWVSGGGKVDGAKTTEGWKVTSKR